MVPLISKITEKTEVSWDDVLAQQEGAHFGLPYCASCGDMVAHATYLSGISYIQGDSGACYGHLYRGDVGEYGFGVHRFFQGIGEMREERRSSAQQYFHTFCGVLRVLMLFVAGVVVVAILLGKSPLTLFAGLGATSAVLMLVFKDTILGFGCRCPT